MNKQEFDDQLNALKKRHATEINNLKKKFADANNTVAVGDTVTDRTQSIVVDSISYLGGDTPSCIYNGIRVTVKGVPFKSGERGTVYQSNMKK